MSKNTKRFKQFRSWFDRYVRRGYGRKCREFAWGCPVCHAHLVKDLLDDFVDEAIGLERWEQRNETQRRNKKKPRNIHR